MTTWLTLSLEPPSTDAEFLQSCARIGDALASLAGRVSAWAGTLDPLRPPPAVPAALRRASENLTRAAADAARAAAAFEDEFAAARGVAARGLALTGHDTPAPGTPHGSPDREGEPPITLYTTARAYRCPQGCPADFGTSHILPEEAGLAPVCMTCRSPLVPDGKELTGKWKTEPCLCVPPPGGHRRAGPPRDTRTCKWCGGTAVRAACTVCLASGCNGRHPECLDCDGSGTLTCPDCGGDGTVVQPEREIPCPDCHGRGCGDCEETGTVTETPETPCPRCKGREKITCPGCQGSGKPRRGKDQDRDPGSARQTLEALYAAGSPEEAADVLEGLTKAGLTAVAREAGFGTSGTKAEITRKLIAHTAGAKADFEGMRRGHRT